MKRISIRALNLLMILLVSFSSVHACEVNLNWTAPGDDGMEGSVSLYDIRYSEHLITDNNWDEATPINFDQEILPAGSRQGILVENLEPGRTYFFALKSCDEVANWAPMSNVVPKVAGMEVCEGVTGNIDCGEDGMVNIADLTAFVDYLFLGGELGCCVGEANIYKPNEPVLNIMDLTSFIQFYYYNNYELTSCN